MNERTGFAIAPSSVTELLDRLDASLEDMPKRLKQCASFTRNHLHLVAVSTVSDMAEASEVAPSAYMRFCQALGFSGYTEMQALFRHHYTESRPSYEDRLANLNKNGTPSTEGLLGKLTDAGHKSLIAMNNHENHAILDRVAEGMAAARVIHLVGLRRAVATVSNLAYTFDKLGIPAVLHYGAGMLDGQGAIFEGDVLLAATYAPFSPETVDFARGVAGRGVTVFGVTDSDSCPVADFASEMLILREDEVAGFRSLTASITLTTALALAVQGKREQA